MQKEAFKTMEKDSKKMPPMKQQVLEILAVITAFSNLLTKETEALKKADFKTVDALQDDKKVFAKQYEAKVMALAERREEMTKLDLPTREKLAQARATFNKVLDDNMLALNMAQNSTKRLVNRILEIARHVVTEKEQTNYSKAGHTMAYKSATMSLSIDQKL